MLTGNQIRKLYLDYFKNKHQHTVVESSSLVPDNPTVLLTTAGMLQFLPIFLGIVNRRMTLHVQHLAKNVQEPAEKTVILKM